MYTEGENLVNFISLAKFWQMKFVSKNSLNFTKSFIVAIKIAGGYQLSQS